MIEEPLQLLDPAFRALMDHAADGIFVTDNSGGILDVSRSVETMLGYTRAELLGMNSRMLVHPEDRSENPALRQMAEGEVVMRTQRLQRKDGSYLLIEGNGTRLDNGRLFAIVRDVSVQKRQADRLQVLSDAAKAFAESSSDIARTARAVVRSTAEAIGDACVLRLATPDGVLEPVAAYHVNPDSNSFLDQLLETVPIRTDAGLNGQVFTTRRPLLVGDWSHDPASPSVHAGYESYVDRVGIQSLVMVPVLMHGNAIGTLTLVRDRGGAAYTLEDQQLLEELAERAAISIENARLLEEARSSREQHVLLAESLPQLVWMTAADGTIEYLNQNWIDYTGFGIDETSVRGWPYFLPPEDVDLATKAWIEALENGGSYEIEYRLKSASGEYRWFLARGVPQKNARSEIVRWFGTCTDIHDRKLHEQEIRRLNAELELRITEFQTLFDAIPVGISIADDPHCMRIRHNPTLSRWLNVPEGPNTASGAPGWENLPYRVFKEDGTQYRPDELPMQRAMATKSDVRDWEGVIVREDGTQIHLLGYASPIYDDQGEVESCLGTYVDISQPKTVAQKLALSEERNRRIVETAQEGIWIIDADQMNVFVNDRMGEMLGYEPVEMIGKPAFEFMTEEGRKIVTEQLGLRRQGMRSQYDSSFVRKDGSTLWVILSTTPLFDSRGNYTGAMAMMTDITERRLAEEALRVSENRYRTMIEQSPLSTQIFDPDGRTIQVNAAWERLWGVTLKDIEGYNILRDAQLEERGILFLIEKGFAGQALSLPAIRYDPNETIPNKTVYEDAVRWTRAFIYPVKDDKGAIREVVLIHEDITDRMRAETALRDRQVEVESLNQRLQLAMAETHHRVKNNLQVISALVDMNVMRDEQFIPTEEFRRLGQHVRSLAALHDLLTGHAKSDPFITHLSTREALEKLRPLIEQAYKGRPVRFNIEETRLPLKQGSALAMLVNELVSNAMKHGAGTVDVKLTVEDDASLLFVSDDGPGFPDGFSAQEAANTGLELVESLVRWDLHGAIEYGNRPEGGARVAVRIPLNAPLQSGK
jgi:PAS domain S-box-containing protein